MLLSEPISATLKSVQVQIHGFTLKHPKRDEHDVLRLRLLRRRLLWWWLLLSATPREATQSRGASLFLEINSFPCDES